MDTNTRTIINLNTWERKQNYDFFKGYLNPQYSITSEVDCTQAYITSKTEKTSFFTKYLYAILRAVNEVPELCYRIEEVDGVERVVLYKKISVITPIRVGENGKFHSICIPYHKTFETFEKAYQSALAGISKENCDPYAAEKKLKTQASFNDKVLVSSLPDLYYTSLTFTQHHKNGSENPLISVGKAIDRDGKKIMPIAICCHHGLCDGYHLSSFFKKVQEYLNQF